MPMDTVWTNRALPVVLGVVLIAGCGAGTAAVVAGSGDTGGGGTTPALDLFAVENPKVSPGRMRLDASAPVRVGLFYDFGAGGGEQPMSRLRDGAGNVLPGNEVALGADELTLDWDFASEPGGTSAFRRDARLMAKLGASVIGGGELALGLGNDAPVVLSVDQIQIDPDEGEASGTTGIELTVADSSDDVVSVKVEFDIQGDDPDAGWQRARPALLDASLPTPEYGITNVRVADGGTRLTFFWDTNALTDLKDLERTVRLRFTAFDGFLTGPALESAPFRVDNNQPPIIQLQNDAVIANPDERRGIPIPFRVIDEEGDMVEVIFQWRREGEEFPSLDTDGDGKVENEEVDAILADPILRQEHHICSEYPRYAQGRVVPIDANTVRLPELASSESWILASGIVGKTLELLRPSSIPAPITPTWASNPLVSPIAALPLGDGLTALVLDIPGQGRLREIELATGAIVREIATLGPGLPSAMAFEKRERAVLVALDDAGTWRLVRVELASGAIAELSVSDGTEPAPVRGIASLGTDAAVFTAGTSLFQLDYRDPLAPQIGKLLTDLATPWGVVVDPLPADRLYVSERDANRVLAIDLDSHGKLPVVVKTADLQPATLDAPTAIALEHHGSRLLIVTSAPGGDQLLGLDLGAKSGNRSFPIGAVTAARVDSLASGTDGLRLQCLSSSNELAAAGGLDRREVIAFHSPSTQEISVETSLEPLPTSGQLWRIREDVFPLPASAPGTAGRFLWDSADAPGFAILRALGRDEEVGAIADGTAPKRVRAGLDVESLTLGGLGATSPFSVAAADLDGDGDQDLVSGNQDSNNLTIFFQLSPGSYSASPQQLAGLGATSRPLFVAAADLDGDGDQDLVSANSRTTGLAGGDLTVFFQLSPGSFSASPLVLGGSGGTEGPRSVAAADLDGDGDQDLVSANSRGRNLTVFFQLSPGSFSTSPLALGGPGVTEAPFSVAAADLDGDGDQDLVSANSSSNLTIFFQLSPGSFSDSPLSLGGHGVTETPVCVAAADLDGDGDQDLVSANRNGSNLTVFYQLSPGSFSVSPLALGRRGVTNGPVSVAAADLDGDGDQDLVSANADGDCLTVFLQRSRGSFGTDPFSLGGPGTTEAPLSVVTADLDGDGDQDLVSANNRDSLTVFLQFSPESYSASPLQLGGTTSAPTSVAAADLDGDGDQDLVSANQLSSDLTVFFQLSPGSFSTSPLVLGGSGFVAAADLDGDGDQDLVSGYRSNLAVFFQLSPGSFSDSPLTLGGSGVTEAPFSVAAADLDGDGDQDLVSANFNTSNLTVFLQLSPGSFSDSPIPLGGSQVTSRPVSVVAADLDGDGDQDLASANEGGFDLTVFFQLSPGSFSDSPLALGGLGVTDAPVWITAADLDGDGDQDLVSANDNGNNLTVFFQLSPGSFSTIPLVLGGAGMTDGPRSVAAADLDGDGDQDLVSANNGGNNLTVFYQLSPGRFAAAPLALGGFPITNGPASVAIADLDGDGDQDLVSANSPGNNLTVFFGGR